MPTAHPTHTAAGVRNDDDDDDDGVAFGRVAVGPHEIAYLAHNRHLLADPARTPVVFVHGLSMSVRFWELAMLAPIRERLPWFSISLPLHAPSRFTGPDVHGADLSERAFASALGEVVGALVGARAVRVVGHSVGGFAALAFARHYGARCAGVLCVGGFAQGSAEGLRGGLRFIRLAGRFGAATFRSLWGLQQRSRWFMGRLVRQYAADRRALEAYPYFEPTLDLVYPDLRAHSLEGQLALVRALLALDLLDDAHEVTCPVVMVAGSRDPVVGFEHQRRVADYYPRGRLVVLEGAGHLGFAERPGRFDAALLEFCGLGGEGAAA